MFNTKRKIALFLGGQSSEHEVSLSSALNILKQADFSKYSVLIVKIQKTGDWVIASKYLETCPDQVDEDWLNVYLDKEDCHDASAGLTELVKRDVEIALILPMHGQYGEDGRLQAFLEMAGIAYTGSGVLASALAMDKVRSMELFAFHGLSVPKFISFTSGDVKIDTTEMISLVEEELGFPCVLKPSEAGSSVATFIIRDKDSLEDKIKQSFAAAQTVIFQEYIKGDEVTCGVVEKHGEAIALAPTQIIPKSGDFFDYSAKYTVAATEEITPANLPKETIEQIQETALLAHSILGCSGLSRTDMIVKDDILHVLETNTLPGMTQTSLLPQGASAIGIDFKELIDLLIESAKNNVRL